MAKLLGSRVTYPPILPYAEGGPGRHLKSRLRCGDILLGGMVCEYLCPSLAKIYRQAGFDFLFIEYEHSFFDARALASIVLVARDNGLPVIAKTPQLERAEVAKLLECGIVAIQLPRTECRADVDTLMSYIKFPPRGSRAIAPGYGNSDYTACNDWRQWMKDQDEETVLVVHIETRLGYENAEEIIATPGVDMVYLGVGDFSVEMGYPGQYDHPHVTGPMEEILALCAKYNVPFGTTASGIEAAEKWVAKGARFFEVIDEITLIRQGACKLVSEYRKFCGPRI